MSCVDNPLPLAPGLETSCPPQVLLPLAASPSHHLLLDKLVF